MRRKTCFLLILLLPLSASQAATTRTWRGPAGGDWFHAAHWEGEDLSVSYPQTGDAVLINTGSVLLTNATAALSAFTLANATLTVSNWTTTIHATTVVAGASSRITMPGAFTDASGLSNRIHIVCTDFTLDAQADILADARGYAGGAGPGRGGNGNGGGGAGFGGVGAAGLGILGGKTYGVTHAPTEPGSGGGIYNGQAHGGGAVRIEASGTVIINGTVSANGANGDAYDGGGSGGSIYIDCALWGGTGILRAHGGEGRDIRGGAGGGGRIAVHYQALSDDPDVTYSVRSGVATYVPQPHPLNRCAPVGSGLAQMGSLWFSDTQVLDRLVTRSGGTLSDIHGYIAFGSTNIWHTDQLGTLYNANLGILPGHGFAITNHLTISGGSLLVEADAVLLQFGGDLTLTNGADFIVFAGLTDPAVGAEHGALVTIDGTLRIASDSWYMPLSHPTNGGSVHLRSAAVAIAAGGGIDANQAGLHSYQASVYGEGAGASSGSRGGGGGYGGAGGRGEAANAFGGGAYGETNRPLRAGSAGGIGHSPQPGYGHGGGCVRIETGPLVLEGSITANGRNAAVQYGGGGSGGGVFILCDSLEGRASGLICALGGNGGSLGGGGGGGRVAVAVGMSPVERTKLIDGDEVENLFVYTQHGPFSGTLNVANGTGSYMPAAQPGSAVFMTAAAGTYSLVVAGDPGAYGTPQPQHYGTTIGIAADSILTNSVTTPADAANGLRHACIGWRLTDESETLVDADVTAQAVFTLTANRILTWSWTNEYELVVAAGPNGSVNSGAVDGWYTQAAHAAGITATADSGYRFQRWIGNVPEANLTNNPLTLVMNQPRPIQAEFASISGESKTWAGNGVWSDYGNWDPPGAPGPHDTITIASGNLLLPAARTVKAATVSSGSTVVFTNWSTALMAVQDVVIAGTLTLPPPFRCDTEMSNRVWIVCRDFTLAAGGVIDVVGKGYFTHTGPGKGGGWGSNHGSGAGHGGCGGASDTAAGGSIYGVSQAPVMPGSGGGGTYDHLAGHGGGVVWIDASRDVVINGTLAANGGGGGTYNGGGAGGSIFIIADHSFAGGATGSMRAAGGKRGSGYTNLGGGAGGRIAIWHGSIGEIGVYEYV